MNDNIENSHIWDEIFDATGSGCFKPADGKKRASTIKKPPVTSFANSYHVNNEQRSSNSPYKYKSYLSLAQSTNYVTDQDRACAMPPKSLGYWTWNRRLASKYDPNPANEAFKNYYHRQEEKSRRNEKFKKDMNANQQARYNVDVSKKKKKEAKKQKKEIGSKKEGSTETAKVKCLSFELSDKKSSKETKKTTKSENKETTKIENKDNKAAPAFYGSIEAEAAASYAAEHISIACDNLKKLQFVADDAYKQSRHQLDQLNEIMDELKDFNAQLKDKRTLVKLKEPNKINPAANFILDTESSIK